MPGPWYETEEAGAPVEAGVYEVRYVYSDPDWPEEWEWVKECWRMTIPGGWRTLQGNAVMWRVPYFWRRVE